MCLGLKFSIWGNAMHANITTPHPGETTCRFLKDARDKAKKAGAEEEWHQYLDIDTLEKFQAAEKQDTGTVKIEPTDTQSQMDAMKQKLDDLSSQFRAFLSLQSQGQPPMAATGVTPPTSGAVSTVVGPTRQCQRLLYLDMV